MPPKSAKKERKPLWLECDKCGTKIINEKMKNHTNECGTLNGYGISNQIFKSTLTHSLPLEIDSKDTSTTYLQRFVFIPESVCVICNFTMNCNLLIELDEKKYVRTSWTVSDKHMDSFFSNSEEFKLEFSSNKPINISRFNSQSVRLMQSIELHMSEKLQDKKNIERLLRVKLKDTIIHSSNIFVIDFLNKKIKFTIKSMTAFPEDDISEKFSQINLNNDHFYMFTDKSLIKLTNESEHSSLNSENKLKFSLSQIGGLEDVIEDLRKTLNCVLGIETTSSMMKLSRGVLIHGIPGSGKSMLTHALASSYSTAKIIVIDSWKIFSKFYGESESNLKKHFDDAFLIYPTPAIIIIDEISNICPKNDSSDAVRRVSSSLALLLDSLHIKRNASKTFVFVNTSNLDNVDPAIRRSGRLDYEIEVPVPNTEIRHKILNKMLLKHQQNLTKDEVKEIAKHTHGFVGADLENLISKSMKVVKINGSFKETFSFSDIMNNLSSVKPSAMRELLIEKPDIKWSDIGGMKDLKLKLKQIVEWPINHPETFARLGIKPPRGLLMFGPPGCSKTMIAKALATESNLNFISIKGSDLFSMWVGESEKAVRDLFVKARQLSPCIIFFDEIDAIGGERSAESGSSVKERVLAQILTEIDGVHVLKNVIIIAATNRPDLIDKAIMRPGRLDRIVYVQLPDAETRKEIFEIKLKKIPIADDVKIDDLVNRTSGYSGAEIEAICKEAALKALEDSFDVENISVKYFYKALEIVKPRTSPELMQLYHEYEMRQ
ncbi:CLUMA_CG013961, isoform A [Clunio marinus]|uniref:CLUMA_CG013961, isoform A n=1 Tax=Clunio marinus TaxID=568069 RepID=A0A1J1IKK4_9DIPT|nr:CLUMA_CG013961, isoform A [Clunio marinus]